MAREGERSHRLLTTVLLTDIVGSTERAAAVGDRGWKDLLARHHAIVRRELRRFHGRERDTAGDGFFATFDQPAEAIECAVAINEELRALGLEIRAGIHTGEAELMDGKVGGMTVHVASRALGHAGPGEILVTNTVREIASGADVAFSDRGVHQLKGVPGRWHVYGAEWKRRAEPVATLEPVEATRLGATSPTRQWLLIVAAVIAVTAVIAVAGVVAWALLAGGDSSPPLVAVPNSAIRIDAATDGIVSVVPAGDKPTGIASGDGTVWVVAQGGRLLTAIPTAGGAPRTIGLPGSPTGIAVGEGAAWVTFGFGASGERQGLVLRVSAGAEQEQHKIDVASGATGIAVGENAVWVVNGNANTLTKIDPATRTIVKTVDVGEQPVAVTTGEGSVWVAHGVGKSVWRLDPQTLARTREIAVADAPTAITAAFGRIWVASASGNSVVVIDVATNTLVSTIKIEQGPRGIAAGADALWVAGARNALVRIDPASRAVVASVSLSGPAEGVAVSGTSVWVTVQK